MARSTPHTPSNPSPLEQWESRHLGLFPVVLVAAEATTETTGRSNDVLVWLVAPLLIGAFILAGLALRAYRRERARLRARQAAALAARSSAMRPAPSETDASSPSHGVVTMVALNISESEGPRLPMPVLPSVELKVCRTCRREYRTALSSCPFDQTKLVPVSSANNKEPRDDYLDTRRSVMHCSRCDRQFDLGIKFCPYDGEVLTAVEQEDERAYYDGQMVCPECGEVFDEEAYFCPDDGARLLPGDPNPAHVAFGALPLLICPDCKREFPPSVTHCPDDGRELLTLVGRKTGGFPGRGLGPLEHICPECGDRFGSDTSYCSHDGSPLIRMN